ncbi:MAG: glycosyltransferase family 4 protein [Candidatus Omnitrophica bacterium]|nr:glycosyltransferase family 4 protein [Candidatus Omnitrophota bacterium]
MSAHKKKILFVITYLELGGAQKQLLSIIKKLNTDKYSLYLFAGDSGYLKEEFKQIPYLEKKLIPELKRSINPVDDIKVFFKLYNYIRKERFDIVHTHSPKASILGRWAAYSAGVKNIIYTVHGWPFHKFMPRALYWFFLFLERLTANITKKIIVVSKGDLKIGIDRRIAPEGRIILIHYGVDIKMLDDIYKRRKKRRLNDMIINISSLKRQKGLSYFLKSAKSISDKNGNPQFFIIGDGPLRQSLERDVEKEGLGDRVNIEGWVGDISGLLSNASILMLTSLWEGLPLCVIEAALAGVPMVVTDTGGSLDIVANNRNGIVVRPGSAEELSRAALSILGDYKRWISVIEEERKNLDISYWSCERMLDQLDNIYGTCKEART